MPIPRRRLFITILYVNFNQGQLLPDMAAASTTVRGFNVQSFNVAIEQLKRLERLEPLEHWNN